MHRRQGWKEVMADGRKREIRATRQGRTWRIQSRIRGDEEWTDHDPPPHDDLQRLLELLKRKYRRRRASLREIQNLEKHLQDHTK